MTIAGISEIVRDAFGLWITALFDAILVPNPTLPFEEHKEAFFWLIEKLLREGQIRFCPPNELWREGCDVWDVDASTIVSYLREHWPASAKSKNDLVLSDYFYALPAILWIGDDGGITSS
ncbi:hypothetical protein VOI32_35925 [Paraburkholderia caribensis]|uniref:Uncharacterized protein n=2 Tax=Paraburkholderia TaxID=1822464 RepID=B2JXG9_PARP8|nr:MULTISPECIES: hypothetical protein [Paraburkholderia]ACC76327.1 hypothetical protein Bphy_7342 [Paraburkholderia phymatum STM815]MCO4881786.1 hypothetical protein [Paraburkholderia caribensis]PTB24174.1 hypothetical protein C9I56_35415 [Paraburkholderia caribensis]